MSFSSGGGKSMADINVTPLVDVMLVLLIIFMVTAPLITTGVKIDLPRANAPQIESTEKKLTLSITRDRKVFLDAAEIAYDDIEAKLKANARVQSEKELFLDADRSLPYGVVVDVMAKAKRAGVASLGMITEPEKSAEN